MRARLTYGLATCLALAMVTLQPASAAEPGFAEPGTWIDGTTGRPLDHGDLMADLARKRVVLLGESHTVAEHHRWQLQTMSALAGRGAKLAVGFEMLPRGTQSVLDDWAAGRLDAETFLKRADWRRNWGYDAALYLPLLHFARMHRAPAIALNVDRGLIRQVGEKGWDGVPAAERQGISTPRPASEAYLASLAEVFAEKRRRGMAEAGKGGPEKGGAESDSPPSTKVEDILGEDGFKRFVQAQQTWDRAMAEAIAAHLERQPDGLVVGIVGSGHVEYGHGIPHQLADLGVDEVATLMPYEATDACSRLPAGIADALFLLARPDDAEAAPKPRLGVFITASPDGPRVANVAAGSVAEAAGLQKDDVIVSAAGFKVATTGELIEIVTRQAPGTWLPLTLRRGDQTIEAVAKFPQSFEPPQ